MPQYLIQPSFSGGEFSPSLYSRIDIQKYGTALKKAKNAIVHPQGGVSNRPGLKFVGESKTPAKKCRIIPFEVSLTTSFIIEVGEYYFRFYRDDGLILLLGVPFEIAHPYTEAELVNLKYVQSNDVLFLVHPNHKPKKLTHYTDTSWTIEDMALVNGPFKSDKDSTNIPSITGNTGAVNDPFGNNFIIGASATVTYPGTILNSLQVGGLLKFNYSAGAASIQSNLSATKFYSKDALCETQSKLTLTGTWSGSVVLEESTDSGNTWATIATYTGNTTATVRTAAIAGAQGSTSNRHRLKMALISGSVSYKLDGDVSLWDAGTSTYVLTFAAQMAEGTFTFSTTLFSTALPCLGSWRLFSSGTWAGEICVEKSFDNGISWERVRTYSSTVSTATNVDATGKIDTLGIVRIRLTRPLDSGTINLDFSVDAFEGDGIVSIDSVTHAGRTATVTVVKAFPIGAPITWQEGSFSNYRGYPQTIIFFQDRIVFGGTRSEPQTSWCSQTGDYLNFGVSSELKDTDAITLNLPSRKTNEIKNLVGLKEIIVFTSSSEWKIGASGAVLTPTTATQNLQENIGSSFCDPVLIGNRAIFVSPMGTVVRDIGYDYSVDGFVGGNLSLFATHLFAEYSILEMSYQQEPDSLVWAIRSDGKLLSLTYMREQQVTAWTWHETDGLFESVCSIPGDGQNDVYFVVNRSNKRYIEKMGKRLPSALAEDCFFVDSGLTYSGAATSTISGLAHLNGKTVSVLADGYVLPPKVVSAGAISLGASYSKVHVGLPYETDIETLNIEISVQDGVSFGRSMRVSEARISFLNSRGGTIGGSESFLEEIVQNQGSNLGDPIALFSGEFSQAINTSYDEGGRIFFRQSDPLPMTILAIMPKVVFGG